MQRVFQTPIAAVSHARAMEETEIGMRAAQSRTPKILQETAEPIDQRSFFKICNAIEPRGDPVATDNHVASGLRLHGIHVVHQRWRRNDAAEVGGARDEQYA